MEQNRFKRLWQHWLHPRQRVERYFPTHDLKRISEEIGLSEKNHQGQVRFVIESRYPSAAVLNCLDTRTRARQWFGELDVWDTELNTGVLVYISFADHIVEIVADRGISAKVPTRQWQEVCQNMLEHFKRDEFVAGLERGLKEVTAVLTEHFPQNPQESVDELPNDVVLR